MTELKKKMKLSYCADTSTPAIIGARKEKKKPLITIEIQPTCGCVPAYLGKKVKLS